MDALAREVSTAEGLNKPLSWQTVQQWEAGKSAPKRQRLETVAKLLGTSVQYLLEIEDVPVGAYTVDSSKAREIYVVGKGQAGLLPERIWTDGDYPVGATDEYGLVLSADPHAFIVAVSGNSMIPRFNPDEYALVEPSTEPEIEDDVLVRLADGGTMIKKLLSRRNGYRFASYNQPEVLHYPEEDVSWIYYIAHPVPRRKIKQRC